MRDLTPDQYRQLKWLTRLYRDLQGVHVVMLQQESALKREGLADALEEPSELPSLETTADNVQRYLNLHNTWFTHGLNPRQVARLDLRYAVRGVKMIESACEANIATIMSLHPLTPWVTSLRGVTVEHFGRILAETGSLANYATVSRLWKQCGLAVSSEGTSYRRKRGTPFVRVKDNVAALERGDPLREVTAYNPEARVLLIQFATSQLNSRGSYRDQYDRKKAEYQARPRLGPSECPFPAFETNPHRDRSGKIIKCGDGHIENATLRYIAKEFLKDAWCEWQRCTKAAA